MSKALQDRAKRGYTGSIFGWLSGEKGLQLEMFQPGLGRIFLICTPLKEAAPLISHSVCLSGDSARVVVLTTTSTDEMESQ